MHAPTQPASMCRKFLATARGQPKLFPERTFITTNERTNKMCGFSCIRDDELEHVKTMFACERGTGVLPSPNAAAATPRWAQDATPTMSKATAANIRRNKARRAESDDAGGGGRNGDSDKLRTDIARKTPLEAFTAAFNPLRDLVKATEERDVADNLPSVPGRGRDHGGEYGTDSAVGARGGEEEEIDLSTSQKEPGEKQNP